LKASKKIPFLLNILIRIRVAFIMEWLLLREPWVRSSISCLRCRIARASAWLEAPLRAAIRNTQRNKRKSRRCGLGRLLNIASRQWSITNANIPVGT
jgi:hypothetical protein